MIIIVPPVPGHPVETNDPVVAAETILANSRFVCRAAIEAVAPQYRQINAALGLLDSSDMAEIVAHIIACRATQNAIQTSVEAIMADPGLNDAGKLAALAAL